jgi:hypothetical protein
MPALKLPLALMILIPLLSACAQRPELPPVAAAEAARRESVERRQIDDQLKARCPTPGNLTPAELRAVADDIGQAARHWQRTAAEYDRLDDEAKACRGLR